MLRVTTIAPVNIAVIKYWGKADEQEILPINDSVSATLCPDVMCAKTTVYTSPDLEKNRFWLNGKEEPFNDRIRKCLERVLEKADSHLPQVKWKVAICSENNFPTGAGLASSAAGYACLVFALSRLYEVTGDLSPIARLGSGSACRSMVGGWVLWSDGTDDPNNESSAKSVAECERWPEMRVLILVVEDQKKKEPSTSAMRRSVLTSHFLKDRAFRIKQTVTDMLDAIRGRDFMMFAKITMKDSNQFHAICMDTYPPCFYLNEVSHTIITLVHAFNEYKGETLAAYTFDAGPNACIFIQEENVAEFLSIVNYIFPQDPDIEDNQYFRGLPMPQKKINQSILEDMGMDKVLKRQERGKLKFIIYTKVGDGPRIVSHQENHLLSEEGLPI